MAKTFCPTRRFFEVPIKTGVSFSLNHVKIGNDVALGVPDEARAGAGLDHVPVAEEGPLTASDDWADIDYRGGASLEQFDGGFFVLGQVAAGDDRLGPGYLSPPNAHRVAPQQHHDQSDAEQAGQEQGRPRRRPTPSPW